MIVITLSNNSVGYEDDEDEEEEDGDNGRDNGDDDPKGKLYWAQIILLLNGPNSIDD